MIEFHVNRHLCISCGECSVDCPSRIITMDEGGFPFIAAEKESSCYRCQHCLAICPTGAVSILGVRPEESLLLAGAFPDPDRMEALIKGRRSVRRYREENLAPELLQRLLDVAWHAPTGVNSRQVRFTVVDDREKLARLRSELLAGLARLAKLNEIPEQLAMFAEFPRMWEEQGIDVLFRGAPHLLVVSAPRDVPSPLPDCLIALSYFELFAQANGVGTVWDGLAKLAMSDLLPETRHHLGIPDDHLFGYAMVFGLPAVTFPRAVQHAPALIHRV